MMTIAGMSLLLFVGAVPGAAQDSAGSATLSGRVVDAATSSPLEAALVVLLPMPETGLPVDVPDAVLQRAGGARTASTDGTGSYRFEGVGAEVYALRVSRIGFRPATLEVRYSESDRGRLSVSLEVDPVRLSPILVSTGLPPGARPAATILVPTGRIAAERFRQTRSLASDARIVSPSDLRESATAVERDFFRSMHRMAGVGTRDDYSAELWTRGASWGETRVYLDGVPVFNPLHGLGVFSGFSYQGLGTAFFHPGVRAPSQPESGAALLELQSRSGLEVPELEGGAEVSLASAHAWARGPLQAGSGGWSLAARRSYFDVVADAASASDEADKQFPFAFTDVLGRVDLRPAEEIDLQASVLWESDDVSGEIADLLQGTTASWGNLTGQVTVAFPAWGMRARQTIGGTRYDARVREIESALDSVYGAPHEPRTDHEVRYAVVRGELEPADGRWTVGYDVTHQAGMYDGPQPWPYEFERPESQRPVEWREGLTHAGLWGRRKVVVGSRLEVEAGVRVARRLSGGGPGFTVQPSAVGRFQLRRGATLTAAIGKYVQHAQSPASVGPRSFSSLAAGRLWVMSGLTRGPLTTRLTSLGGEVWLGESWLFSATGYLRGSSRVQLPDPASGFLVQRSPWVSGRTSARGIDVTVRRLAGRWVGSVGYSYGRARAYAAGIEFPAPTDRRHTLDVTNAVRLGRAVSLEVAYTYASGAPYARVLDRCAGADCDARLYLFEPFQRRGPDYQSLDLVLDVTHDFGSWHLSWFLQGRNLLSHANAVTYEGSREFCGRDYHYPGNQCVAQVRVEDQFVTGVPRAPLLGFRVTF